MKVVASRRVPDRYYIELENGETIRATSAEISTYALRRGRVLDEETLGAMRGQSELSSARARALRILGTRQRSRADIVRRLIDNGESAETAEQTADWLEINGFVNDGEYARDIARHYAARGYGERRVRQELYKRGIARELWDEAVDAMPQDDDKAYDFIAAKLGGDAPDMAERRRLSGALARRGFNWDEVSTAWAKYAKHLQEAEDEEAEEAEEAGDEDVE
jgi:regulatory protein